MIKRLFFVGDILRWSFSAMGVLYTLHSWFQTTNKDFPIPDEHMFGCALFLGGVVALIVIIYRLYQKNPLGEYPVSNNAKIRVWKGDLLNVDDGSIVVSVNNRLACELQYISPGSLHGQIVKEYSLSNPGWLEGEFKQRRKAFEPHNSSPMLQSTLAPYGYNFTLNSQDNKRSLIFLVTSDLQQSPKNTKTDHANLKKAIDELFQSGGGFRNHRLYIPPVGTGAAGGSNVNPQEIMEYIAHKYVREVTNPASPATVRQVTELVLSFHNNKLKTFDDFRQRLERIIEQCRCKVCPGDLS